MTGTEGIIEMERELAAGDGAAYERHLSKDAVVVVPGATLDKAATVAAMNESPGWLSFEFEDERIVEVTDDVAILSYRFSGSREDEEYVAALTSVYRREEDGWRLVLHQQTPMSEG